MSAIVILIVIVLNVPVTGLGLAFFLVGVSSEKTQQSCFRQVAAMLGAYMATSVIMISILFASDEAITVAGRSAEGGIVEIPMVATLSLGFPFWTMLIVALVLFKLPIKSHLNRSLSGGVLLGIASFNYFIVLYGQKILQAMSINSGSMHDWCC